MEKLEIVRVRWRNSLLKAVVLIAPFLCIEALAVVVTVDVSPGTVLNWNDYANLGPGDTLNIVISDPAGAVQLLSSGNIFVQDTIECNGQLRLTSSAGKIDVAGSISASQIILEAPNIQLVETALIDTSSSNGGGNIYIGGGWHGMDNSIKNAQIVSVSEGVQILADGLVNSSGGIVVLWSQVATLDQGFISSQGSGLNGSGGNVEISSHRFLHFDGDVNVSAQNGSDGQVFFDPFSITIQAANPDIDGNGSNLDMTFVTQLNNATTTPTGFPNASSVITANAVANLLTNNVSMVLAAQSFITVNAALTPAGTGVTLTLEAPTLNLNQPITLASGGALVGVGVNTINVGPSGKPQNAIDLSVNGTTINLSSATYSAPLTIINKNITVNGNGIANTTILGPGGGVPSQAGGNPLIFVQGSTNTVIENLTVNGNFIGFPTNANLRGISYSNAGGTVSNVHVTRIANSAPPYGGGQQGVAIRAAASAGGPFTFNVTQTTIDFFQKAAIVATGSALIANITSNTITGLGVPSSPATIGVQLSSGTTGSVTGNAIAGLQFSDHAQADGILLASAGSNVLVSGNTISNNDEGILSLNSGGGMIIQNNTVSNSGDSGIVILDDSGDTQILSNTLTNNGGLAGPSAGNTSIYIFSSSLETFEISQNSITPAPGTLAYFSQGNAAGQAPDASLLDNIFQDP